MSRQFRLFVAVTLAVALSFGARAAHGEPVRILVAVGHRSGLVGEGPLKHAVADATHVREVFVRLGDVSAAAAFLLAEPTSATLMDTIDRAAALAKGHRPSEVTFIFYFSGHGDHGSLHLGGERVALRDLEAKLAQVPAALRVVVADACRTADARAKGFVEAEPFAITADASDAASGVVHIQASADGEVAQESDGFGGAVFTHYWLTGLAGAADSNGDARVTLAESYAFAYSQTIYRSSRASGVVQRPMAEFDLKEAAPVVLTQTATTSAIKLPAAKDVHYLVFGLGSHAIVGEAWSAPDRPLAIAVVPGKYVVQRRAGGHSAALQVDVAGGERRELRSGDFQPVREDVLVRKGGELVLRPRELSLAYAAGISRLVSFGQELSFNGAYAWDAGFALGVGVVAGLGSRDATFERSDEKWLGLDVTAEERLRLGTFVLRLGAGPRAREYFQTTDRLDADRLAQAGYATQRHLHGTALGGGIVVAVRLPLGNVPWLELQARGDALATSLDGQAAAVLSTGIGAAVGASF